MPQLVPILINIAVSVGIAAYQKRRQKKKLAAARARLASQLTAANNPLVINNFRESTNAGIDIRSTEAGETLPLCYGFCGVASAEAWFGVAKNFNLGGRTGRLPNPYALKQRRRSGLAIPTRAKLDPATGGTITTAKNPQVSSWTRDLRSVSSRRKPYLSNTSPLQTFTNQPLRSNEHPTDIWASGNGGYWVTDRDDAAVYLYSRGFVWQGSIKLKEEDGNVSPVGIWSNGTNFWVADNASNKLFCYRNSTRARVPNLDINDLVKNGNNAPGPIWGDGTRIFVLDLKDLIIYAYTISSRQPATSWNFTRLATPPYRIQEPTGICGNKDQMWVLARKRLYPFNLANQKEEGFAFTQPIDVDHATGLWVTDTSFQVLQAEEIPVYETFPSRRNHYLAMQHAITIGDIEDITFSLIDGTPITSTAFHDRNDVENPPNIYGEWYRPGAIPANAVVNSFVQEEQDNTDIGLTLLPGLMPDFGQYSNHQEFGASQYDADTWLIADDNAIAQYNPQDNRVLWTTRFTIGQTSPRSLAISYPVDLGSRGGRTDAEYVYLFVNRIIYRMKVEDARNNALPATLPKWKDIPAANEVQYEITDVQHSSGNRHSHRTTKRVQHYVM